MVLRLGHHGQLNVGCTPHPAMLDLAIEAGGLVQRAYTRIAPPIYTCAL